ncbi:hypothetical protein UUU_28350 [Klebsiella pneumoniae subsp. pneumoniae DSM 30104 = JCM 1662 = NBRC 14940]|nr:hypothetical protein UUU_28350 [Klebsiella pneumoniae subsp. pneumoniae DSM 30104 = JCM 1662 = NBRC 14940]
MVPGTTSIYGLCFSAKWMIPVSIETVCDPILISLHREKITQIN